MHFGAMARRYLAAILVASSTMRSDAALASAPAIQRRRAVISPSGFELEWLSYPAPPESAPAGSTGAPGSTAAVAPVLFIHGSFHGAWCWEQWMERFSTSLGCTCHAVSLRGTSGSPCDQRSVKISEHVADLAAFVNGPLATETGSVRPLIVGHSFGGASLLKYLEADHPASAAVLLCSVPPSGNSQMTLRFLKRSPLACWRLLRGFAFKAAARDPSIARDLFFDHAMSDDQIDGYLARFAEDCKASLVTSPHICHGPIFPMRPTRFVVWIPRPGGHRSRRVQQGPPIIAGDEAHVFASSIPPLPQGRLDRPPISSPFSVMMHMCCNWYLLPPPSCALTLSRSV